MRAHGLAQAVFGLTLGCLLTGCALLPGWGGRSGTAAEGEDALPPSPVFVTAVPSYRLLVDPAAANFPSRLLVLHVRVTSRAEEDLPFGLANLRLRLLSGNFARVFDRERAAVLVRRTRLGAANLSYLRSEDGSRLSGGLTPKLQEPLRQYVLEHLLADGTLSPGGVMEGYLVVDTLEPLASLDGAVLEATTGDGAGAARDTFLFMQTGAVLGEAGARP